MLNLEMILSCKISITELHACKSYFTSQMTPEMPSRKTIKHKKKKLALALFGDFLCDIGFFSSSMQCHYLAYLAFCWDCHFMYPSHLFWHRVFSFILSEPLKRLSLCTYWVCVIYISVLRFYNISKNSKIERILLRKYYHLMAVLMFLPALISQVIWIHKGPFCLLC